MNLCASAARELRVLFLRIGWLMKNLLESGIVGLVESSIDSVKWPMKVEASGGKQLLVGFATDRQTSWEPKDVEEERVGHCKGGGNWVG